MLMNENYYTVVTVPFLVVNNFLSCTLFHSFTRNDASTSTESTVFETSYMLAEPNFLLSSSSVLNLNRYEWWNIHVDHVCKFELCVQTFNLNSSIDEWSFRYTWSHVRLTTCVTFEKSPFYQGRFIVFRHDGNPFCQRLNLPSNFSPQDTNQYMGEQ